MLGTNPALDQKKKAAVLGQGQGCLLSSLDPPGLIPTPLPAVPLSTPTSRQLCQPEGGIAPGEPYLLIEWDCFKAGCTYLKP